MLAEWLLPAATTARQMSSGVPWYSCTLVSRSTPLTCRNDWGPEQQQAGVRLEQQETLQLWHKSRCPHVLRTEQNQASSSARCTCPPRGHSNNMHMRSPSRTRCGSCWLSKCSRPSWPWKPRPMEYMQYSGAGASGRQKRPTVWYVPSAMAVPCAAALDCPVTKLSSVTYDSPLLQGAGKHSGGK